MKFLLDPKIFNYVIMSLYAANSIRWFFARSVADGIYWLGALIITVSVTFLFKR